MPQLLATLEQEKTEISPFIKLISESCHKVTNYRNIQIYTIFIGLLIMGCAVIIPFTGGFIKQNLYAYMFVSFAICACVINMVCMFFCLRSIFDFSNIKNNCLLSTRGKDLNEGEMEIIQNAENMRLVLMATLGMTILFLPAFSIVTVPYINQFKNFFIDNYVPAGYEVKEAEYVKLED